MAKSKQKGIGDGGYGLNLNMKMRLQNKNHNTQQSQNCVPLLQPSSLVDQEPAPCQSESRMRRSLETHLQPIYLIPIYYQQKPATKLVGRSCGTHAEIHPKELVPHRPSIGLFGPPLALVSRSELPRTRAILSVRNPV